MKWKILFKVMLFSCFYVCMYMFVTLLPWYVASVQCYLNNIFIYNLYITVYSYVTRVWSHVQTFCFSKQWMKEEWSLLRKGGGGPSQYQPPSRCIFVLIQWFVNQISVFLLFFNCDYFTPLLQYIPYNNRTQLFITLEL